jgi:hypothetical protein
MSASAGSPLLERERELSALHVLLAEFGAQAALGVRQAATAVYDQSDLFKGNHHVPPPD